MNKVYFMSFVLAAALPAMAVEEQYGDLFKGVSGGQLVSNDGGLWTTNDAAIATTNVTAVAFETADSTPITLEVTADAADTNTVVKINLMVTLADVGEFAEPQNAQTAFCVCTNSFNVWKGNENGWVALNEVPTGIDDSQPTNLLVEISYQGDAARKARFTVGDTTPLRLRSDGTTEWIPLDDTTSANLAGFAINGEGIIAKADASVMLGVAAYDGIKYGTISNAVEVAKGAGGTPTVEVLRETTEDVTKYAETVNIAAAEGVPVKVKPVSGTVKPTTVAEGVSGEYTASLPEGVASHVSNVTNLQITLPFAYKEVKPGSVAVAPGGTTVTFKVRTASSIVKTVAPGGKALSANVEKLQEFLAKTAAAKSDVKTAYEKANPTAEALATELAKNGDNDIPMYQSYALGIDQNTSVKPVTVANDTSESAITVEIPSLKNVAISKSGDYNTIKYIVKKGDQEISRDTDAGSPISLPLNEGTGSYTIIIDMQ